MYNKVYGEPDGSFINIKLQINNKMKICGVDEAGRGPVIGSLVVCGVMVEEKDIPKLKEIGVRDSKLLTPKARESMAAQIERIAEYSFQVITPQEIDEAMRSKDSNLNWLEAVKIAMVINDLKPDRAILDCPSNNIAAYKKYLQVYINDKEMELEAHHKAESKFEVVAAASILAKVMRDREIAGLRAATGIDFGSGYPNDPKVKATLDKLQKEHPEILRHEWSTIKKTKGMKKLTEYSD